MRKDNLKLNIIEITLIIFLLCFIIFSKIFNPIIIAIVLLVFMVITTKLIKSYKQSGKYNKKLTKLMTAIGIIYIVLIYIIGIYIGFYEAGIKLSIRTIFRFIIPYIVIIVSIEKIRKTVLLKDDKKSNIIILIISVMVDIALTVSARNYETLKDYFSLITFTIFSSIANNMLFNYIIQKHRNSKAIISYRIITTVYTYIIPIVPNIHILFESIIRVIMPFIIYMLLEKMYTKKDKQKTHLSKTRDIIITSILAIITTSIVMLISCEFKYGLLVIGSGSMTGVINKSDGIIYKTLDEDEEIEIGDIIVFSQEETKIIHRVIDKQDLGKETRYYTKGDANQVEDDGYRLREDIVGKVKLRVPYIGILPVALNEALK